MLYEFINTNRDWLLKRCSQLRIARSQATQDDRSDEGVGLFLDQLAEALKMEHEQGKDSSQDISGSAIGFPSHFAVGTGAAAQGKSMESLNLSLNDVVHCYGDVCNAIVELALQQSMSFGVGEYRMLNRCLDNAVSSAVAEFSYQRDSTTATVRDQAEDMRLAAIANELHNQLGTATLAVAALRARELTLGGTTGNILERSLLSLGKLVDDMLQMAQARDKLPQLLQMVPLRDFMQLTMATFAPSASVLQRHLTMSEIDLSLALVGPVETLQAAIAALLQIAFQVSQVNDHIGLHGYASGNNIQIDIVVPTPPELPDENQPAMVVARQLIVDMQGQLIVHNGSNGDFIQTIRLPRRTMPT